MSESANKAVFLSYASQDAEAVRRICESLRASGVEVWFDQNELVGGDAWDAKIRGQVKSCTLFVPVISAATQARREGYFRIEWKIAAQRTQAIADGTPFLLPVVIDATKDGEALVPEEFRAVQWTRLPGGEAPASFCARVKKLLEEMKLEAGSPRPAARDEGVASPGKPRAASRGWLVPAALGFAAVAVLALWQPWKKSPIAGPPPAGADAKAPVAPLSEAQKLTGRARTLYERWDLASPEDLALGEQLLKKAVDGDPLDAEAWAARALLSCCFIVQGIENSAERLAAMRSDAERAIKLDPNSGQARFAWAFSLRFDGKTQATAVRLLKEEVVRQPANHLLLISLGGALRRAGKFEESLVYFDQAAGAAPRDPVTHFNRGLNLLALNRPAEAEAAFDRALALAPGYRNARRWKREVLLDYHGDLAGARALVEKFRPDYHATESDALDAARIYFFCKAPAKCLEALQPVRDFVPFDPGAFTGPKAYLTGRAHQLAGNLDAARSDWQAALKLVEQRQSAQPASNELLSWKARLLASLGQRTEAEASLTEIRQRQSVNRWSIYAGSTAQMLVLLGRNDEAVAELEAAHKAGSLGTHHDFIVTRNELRYHPDWDPLRGNPRFEALLPRVLAPAAAP